MSAEPETIITDDNIHKLVQSKVYIFISEYRLPTDLKNKKLEDWDISRVTNMDRLFKHVAGDYIGSGHTLEDIDLNKWDVSHVKSMKEMFYGCANFNQPLDKWNVGNVTNMEGMFVRCFHFDGKTIKDWDVSQVTNMARMFEHCEFRNSEHSEVDIANWNVGNVENMSCMFKKSTFNSPIGNWNVGKVEDMSYMFANELYCETMFNQNIGKWDVRKVKTMEGMFESADKYNQPFCCWDVRKVENMERMFKKAKIFNQSLCHFNVDGVKNMSGMFDGCSNFNQPLNNWDVRNVKSMRAMFRHAEKFNQPLVTWKVDKSTCDVKFIFYGAKNMVSPTWMNRLNTPELTKLKHSVNMKSFKEYVRDAKYMPPPGRDGKYSSIYWMGKHFKTAKRSFLKRKIEGEMNLRSTPTTAKSAPSLLKKSQRRSKSKRRASFGGKM